MAAVADVTKGFADEVSFADTPDVFGRGARYAVGAEGDLKVTAAGAGDRAVTISAGKAWGDAVIAVWDESTVLNAAANSSGDTGSVRWDTLVVRRDWSAGTATLTLLTGGSSQTLAPGVVLRNPTPSTGAGYTTADQPVALVGVVKSAATVSAANIIDLRLWSGEGGGLYGAHVKARDYVTSVGTTVRIGDVLHTRVLDGTGTPQWDEKDLSRMGGARFDGAGVLVDGTVPASAVTGGVSVVESAPGAAAGGFTGVHYAWNVVDSGLGNRHVVHSRGGGTMVETYLRLRLTDGSIAVDSTGLVERYPNGTMIRCFTASVGKRPLSTLSFPFAYRTTGGGVRSGVARMGTDGVVELITGTPGDPIIGYTTAGQYSIMATIPPYTVAG